MYMAENSSDEYNALTENAPSVFPIFDLFVVTLRDHRERIAVLQTTP
jgi:hypothetical protein